MFLFTNSNDFFLRPKSIKPQNFWVPWVMGPASLKRMRIPWLWQLTARNCGRRCCPKVFKMNIHLKVTNLLCIENFPMVSQEFHQYSTVVSRISSDNTISSLKLSKSPTFWDGFFHLFSLKAWGKTMDGLVVVFPWGRSSYHRQVRMNQKW